MKRKVKRKLFLMGMAVAAGACGPAFAKGSGKAGHDSHDYSGGWPVTQTFSLPFDGARDVDAGGLLTRFKTMLGGLNVSVDNPASAMVNRGWQLELLQPAAKSEASGDPRSAGKQFGLALRMTF